MNGHESCVLVTGGFDPIHGGHIDYFEDAKLLSTTLIVGVNSDEWLRRKKGRAFMSWKSRKRIIEQMNIVDFVIDFDDSDDTANDAIKECLKDFDKVIFCNGGDRGKDNIPEYEKYKNNKRVEFKYDVGGKKTESSSDLLNTYSNPITYREWGHYRVLYEGIGYKVKELVIKPFSKLSMQRHEHRSELWNLVSGSAEIHIGQGEDQMIYQLDAQKSHLIQKGDWHMGCNMTDTPAHIVEIWRGDSEHLTEEDIERK